MVPTWRTADDQGTVECCFKQDSNWAAAFRTGNGLVQTLETRKGQQKAMKQSKTESVSRSECREYVEL